MAGSIQGLQARIRNTYPQAIYVHCFAHGVNLALIKAVESYYIQNLRVHLTDVGKFFSSPRRRKLLQDKIPTGKGPQGVTLPTLTRWTSLEGVNKNYIQLHPYITAALQDISRSTSLFDARVRAAATRLRDTALKYTTVYASVVSSTVNL
jgi:hypothetical protein